MAELRKCLYLVFSQFGKILDVVAQKTPKLKGQAWICFASIAAATNALRSMQDYPFLDKPMVRRTFTRTERFWWHAGTINAQRRS